MTVQFRQNLTNDLRYGYPVIAKQVLMKMGIVSIYDTPDDNILQLVYDTILDTTIQYCDSGMLGTYRTREIEIEPDGSVKVNQYGGIMQGGQLIARPWDHIVFSSENTTNIANQVKLPLHYRDAMGVRRYSRNLECVKMTDMNTCSTMYFMYDGTLKKWMNINYPIFNVDTVPMASIDREGYIADLYIKLSDYFGITAIPQTISDAADRFNMTVRSFVSYERDGEKSYLFGSVQDPMYREPYSILPYIDYNNIMW